ERPLLRRGLRPRRGPAPRARGAASCGASPCPRRGVREMTASGRRRGARWARLAQPTRRDAVLAGVFLKIGQLLRVLRDLLLHAIELGERLLPVVGDRRALCRIVARREVGGQTVDAALKRFRERLRAIERFLQGLAALAPGGLIVFRLGRRL